MSIIATGRVADSRGIAAALTIRASAVQISTGSLHCTTRRFSDRHGRADPTDYVGAPTKPDAPKSAPYPIHRGLTTTVHKAGTKA